MLLSDGVAEHLSNEIAQMWSYLQRFVDGNTHSIVTLIESESVPLSQKMDQMEWLSRSIEFISPEAITKCLIAYSQIKNEQSYFHAKHSSIAVVSLIQMLKHTKMRKDDDSIYSHLAI